MLESNANTLHNARRKAHKNFSNSVQRMKMRAMYSKGKKSEQKFAQHKAQLIFSPPLFLEECTKDMAAPSFAMDVLMFVIYSNHGELDLNKVVLR